MTTYSTNYNLYKWDKTDTKLTTITESANNADKIDTALTNINTDVNSAKSTADAAVTTANNAQSTATTVQTQFNQVVAQAGSNNPEVVQARGTYAVLNDRLNDVDAHLAQIATVGVITKSYPRLAPETDDSPRLQRAINYAVSNGIGKVLITENNLTLNTAINLTNLTNGLIVEGLGMGAGGTLLLGHTSGVMFDVTGSQYVTLRNLYLKSDYTANASTIGILFARSTTNQYAEFNNLENVKIDMPTNTSANSGNGTIGIYNLGAELARYRNIHVLADRAVCFTYYNNYGITSPFVTLTANGISMSECVIDGSSTLVGYAFACVLLNNVANIKLDNIYMNLGQAVGANNSFAIESFNGNTSFEITGHIEGYPQFINAKAGLFYHPLIRVSKQIPTANLDQIVLDGTGSATAIYGGKISLVNMLNPTYAHNLLSQIGTAHNGVINCEINLLSYQGINCSYGYTSGNRIISQDANPSITLSGNGYNNGTIIQTQNHTTFNGVVDLGTKYTFGGNSVVYGQSAPTTGTWAQGDRVINTAPTAGGYEGWVCVTAGTPGTWKGFGAIQT